MLTYGEAKESRRLKNVANLCPGSADFTALLNDTTRELMRRGQWWNTVRRMTGCVFNECIVWPRQVGTVLAINRCNHSIPPKNHWANFDPVLPEDVHAHNRFCGRTFRCWGNIEAVDYGVTSVFNQIPCLNDRFVRAYISQPSDEGKTVTIFGIDTNGQTIRSQRADGTYQDGIVLQLSNPYVQSSILIRQIDYVLKDPTNGPINLFQFDGKTLYDLAHYDASETTPEYRQSKISGGGHVNVNPNCCGPKQITALIKLAFIPVVHDDDLVLIDNLDALALGMQALNQSDAYDHAGAEQAMARAVHTLNLDLRSRLPIDQIPTKVHYQGTAKLHRIGFGRML